MSTAWGLRLGRRGSMGQPAPAAANRPASDGRDRIALDISILKRQYEKLRERQRQAHIILTSTSRQSAEGATAAPFVPVNQYLQGRSAIVSSKGRRIGPPAGAIPPIRKVPAAKTASKCTAKSSKKSEGMQWKEINAATAKQQHESSGGDSKPNSDSASHLPLKKSSSVTSTTSTNSETSPANSASMRSHKKSESSSYSDDSDGGNSSTSTSLCDEENFDASVSSVEASPMRRCVPASGDDDAEVIEMLKTSKLDECISTLNKLNLSENCEILTCVSGEMSSRVEGGEVVDAEVDDRGKTGKLEVICEEKVDSSSKESGLLEIEDVQESTGLVECLAVVTPKEILLEYSELNPRNSAVVIAEEKLSNQQEKNTTTIDTISADDGIIPIIFKSDKEPPESCETQIASVQQTSSGLSEANADCYEIKPDDLKGTLSVDTLNLLKRIERSQHDTTVPSTTKTDDKDVYQKYIDRLKSPADGIEVDKEKKECTDDIEVIRECEFPLVEKSLLTIEKDTGNEMCGNDNIIVLIDERNFTSIAMQEEIIPIKKDEFSDADLSEVTYNLPTNSLNLNAIDDNEQLRGLVDKSHISIINESFEYLSTNKEKVLSRHIEEAVAEGPQKSEVALDGYDIKSSNERSRSLFDGGVTEINMNSNADLTKVNNQQIYTSNVVKPKLDENLSDGKMSFTKKLEEQDTIQQCPSPSLTKSLESNTTDTTEKKTELELENASLELCKPEPRASKSASATKQLLENNLLMEHILNPIANESASIDDVLIEHFTSLNADANKNPEGEILDLDSIEEIRRKYYASTKSLSNSMHEAEAKANLTTNSADFQTASSTSVEDVVRRGAALLSPSYDHLPTLLAHSTLISSSLIPSEIKSKSQSSANSSTLITSSTLIADSPDVVVPSVPMSTTVSKLPTVRSIDQPIDDPGLSLKVINNASITSTSQLSPMVDFSKYRSTSSISPIRSPANNASYLNYSAKEGATIHVATNNTTDAKPFEFKVNDEGVTNEYFERVTVPPERPSRLELRSSTSDDTCAAGFVNDDLTRDIHLNAFVVDSPCRTKTRPSDDVFDDDTLGIRSYASISKEHDFMKEKSFSLDEPSVNRDEFKPSSCPENVLDSNQFRKSERVSRIIQENSKILHRFLRRNVCVDEEELGGRMERHPNVVTGRSEVVCIADAIRSEVEVGMSKGSEDGGYESIVQPEKKVSEFVIRICSEEREIESENIDSSNINDTYADISVDTPKTDVVECLVTNNVDRKEITEYIRDKACDSTTSDVTQSPTKITSPQKQNPAPPILSIKSQDAGNLFQKPQIKAEPPKDIAETISSIKNTIKSIDTLCKRDDSNQRNRDKTIEVIESLNECRYRKLEPIARADRPPSSSRYSRDIRREISPRRTGRDSDREEYESLFKRDSTMSRSTSVLPSNSCNSDLDRLYQMSDGQHIDDAPNFSRNSFPPINFTYPIRAQDSTSPSVKITTLDLQDTSGSPSAAHHMPYAPPSKSHIRHTTVTSTFYDRIQAQQKEKSLRMDRSPTAHHPPVTITKAYLNSLRVTNPAGCSPRSVDTSPSHRLTKKDHSGSLSAFVVPPFRRDLAAYKPPYKSCDNIPEKTKNSDAMAGYKYAY